MRPSMCQKSHDACTTFHYNYLFSLLSSSPNLTFIVKKNGIHLSFSTLMLLYLITDRSHYHNIWGRLPKNFYFCIHEVASSKKYKQIQHVVHCNQTFAA